MSQQPEETVGLDLFDETASAAGSFPHSMLGYERQAVDAYIRDIERQLSSAKRKVRSLQKQIAATNTETDLSKVGAHARDLLRAAEAEAAELRNLAKLDAERIVSEATEQAASVTNTTQADTATHRVSNAEELGRLRVEFTRQTEAELAAAREEAQLLRDAAENHRRMVLADAERNATALRDQATLQADQVRQAAERAAADVRARVAAEHAEALDALERKRAEVTAVVTELTERARVQSEQFGATLAKETALLNDRRSAANAHADQIVADAEDRAKATIAEARAVAVKREREAGAAEAAKVARLNEEIARLTVRVTELRKLLKGLSTMATEFAADDDATGHQADDQQPATEASPKAAPAVDEPAVNPVSLESADGHAPSVNGADDDATRVQAAVSGGRNR